jgi:hypothetical protein
VRIVARLNDKQFKGYRLRPIPHPIDDIVASVVEAFQTGTPSQRQAVLDDMTDRAGSVLCAFAERLAAVAVRNRSAEPLQEALVAVGIAVEALDDYRDHLYPLVTVNHSAVMLGMSFAALVESVAHQLPATGLARLHEFDRRDERHRSLRAFELQTQGEGSDFRYC